ncbi:Gfo/Idh/MocA family protein [Pedobacter sp. L105]|uniref:Gfo/Idh/MocA family protein n=1 Tax=Pedobacter sp. L105 TaxID=1641871 RepID=UPI00131C78C8|nr:Gfo/Idh/MocA family oxidoreductase [Pedobacter sp. L105]
MGNINWGMIGAGEVTEKRNGPAFNNVAGSSLVAVMRRNGEKAEDYARRHGIDKWYTDAAELMNNKDVNAIYISTPPSSHMDYAIEALNRGFNVYLEKPAALNAEQAREIAKVLKQHPAQKLTVAHYRRVMPLFLKVKEFIDHKLIGDIRTVQIRTWQNKDYTNENDWYIIPEISGGGYFHSVAPHQLDLMLYYFGEPAHYEGFSLNQCGLSKADDHVSGEILFKNKVVVNGSWCFTVAENQITDTCEIVGTKGKITLPFSGDYVKWKTDKEEQTMIINPPQYAQQPLIEKIVAYFNDEGPNPCSIEEAIVSMEMMDVFTRK